VRLSEEARVGANPERNFEGIQNLGQGDDLGNFEEIQNPGQGDDIGDFPGLEENPGLGEEVVDMFEEARIAANLERHFHRIKDLRLDMNLGDFPGLGANFVVVDIGIFPHENTTAFPNGDRKAITIRDTTNGNIFIHFDGTGDGTWEHNGAAFAALPVADAVREDNGVASGGLTSADVTWEDTGLAFSNPPSADGAWADNAVAFDSQPSTDGTWEYNGVTFHGLPSDMQNWALSYFDDIVSTHIVDRSEDADGLLFVTGHSQGGNNAQFVTIRSEYGDLIDATIALDAPGFSNQFVHDSILLYGEVYYNSQCRKIWAFNGEYDFVSTLGQTHIVPEDQIRFLQFTGNPMNFRMFHHIRGKLNAENGITLVDSQTDFRRLVEALNSVIASRPQEQQSRGTQIMMQLAESSLHGPDTSIMGDITQQDFNDLKELLVPVLVTFLADHHETIAPALLELGFSQPMAEATGVLIEQLNTHPQGTRELALNIIFKGVVVKDGQIEPNFWKINLLGGIVIISPAIVEAALLNPGTLYELSREPVEKAFSENPVLTVCIALGSACIAINLALLAIAFPSIMIPGIAWGHAIAMVPVVTRIAQGATWLTDKTIDGIVAAFTAIKNAIQAFAEWVRTSGDKYGSSYAANNPYIRVDTERLREYASRINRVNSRINSLDEELRRLYSQSGLIELRDLIDANLVMRYSHTLNEVSHYLKNTAGRFEAAEIKARGYMEG